MAGAQDAVDAANVKEALNTLGTAPRKLGSENGASLQLGQLKLMEALALSSVGTRLVLYDMPWLPNPSGSQSLPPSQS